MMDQSPPVNETVPKVNGHDPSMATAMDALPAPPSKDSGSAHDNGNSSVNGGDTVNGCSSINGSGSIDGSIGINSNSDSIIRSSIDGSVSVHGSVHGNGSGSVHGSSSINGNSNGSGNGSGSGSGSGSDSGSVNCSGDGQGHGQGSADVAISSQASAIANASLSYTPQFSNTGSFILARMKTNLAQSDSSKSTSLSPGLHLDKDKAKEENIRKPNGPSEQATPHGADTSMTMLLPTPPTYPASLSKLRALSSSPFGQGQKRKRDSDDGDKVEKVDFSQNTMAFPMPPEPPADKPVMAPMVVVENSESILQDDQRRQRPTEALREKRLAQLPRDVVPAKVEMVGFGPGQSSNAARTEYFRSKKKTDLLNLLSFCDQLKPQLLVDVLVSISNKHPNLPMFDSPDWESRLPHASGGRGGLDPAIIPKARAEGKHRHNHGQGLNLAVPKISRPKHRPSKKAEKVIKVPQVVKASHGPAQHDDDALPSTWHKAGEGLYAKLVPEVDDRQFLADENDEEAFSHFMVDSAGKQVY